MNTSKNNIQDINNNLRRSLSQVLHLHYTDTLINAVADNRCFSGKHSRPLSANAQFLNVKAQYDLDI